jgi:hypothetical protein
MWCLILIMKIYLKYFKYYLKKFYYLIPYQKNLPLYLK